MSFKRTNRATSGGHMETILVGSGDQPLASGALVGASTSLGIANGQLGALSWDFDGTIGLGNFITAGTTAANVKAIKVLQGTPYSSSTQNVESWEVDHKGYVESSIIYRDQIRSVMGMTCKPGSYSAHAFTDLPTPADETEYGYFVYLDSVRNDRDWSDNDEVISEVFQTIDFTTLGTTNPLDWTIQNALYKLNFRSKLASLSNSAVRRGNRDVIAFAINTAGGAGQALGTITCGTVIPVMNDNGSVTNIVANEQLVSALAKVIKNQADAVAGGATITNQIVAASTIEVINLTTAGTVAAGAGNAASNAFIVVGLNEGKAAYFDDIEQVAKQVEVNLSLGFRSGTFVDTKAYAEEGTGQGWKWAIQNNDRAQLNVHTKQVVPFGEFFSRGITYVNPDLSYTSYIIDYFDFENTLTTSEVYEKQLIVLLPCTATCVTVSAAVTNLATGPAIPGATDDTTTTASLEAILGAWLDSAATYSGHTTGGESATGAIFV